MGQLVDGLNGNDTWVRPSPLKTGGNLNAPRQRSHWAHSRGSAGPSGEGGFEAESGRYTPLMSRSPVHGRTGRDFPRLKGVWKIISA